MNAVLAKAEQSALESSAVATLIQELRNWNEYPLRLNRGGPETSLGRAMSQAVLEHRDRLTGLSDGELLEIVDHIGLALWPREIDSASVLARDPESMTDLAVADLRYCLQTAFFDISDAINGTRATSLVLGKFPELEARLDEDDLLALDGCVTPGRCYLSLKGHALYYSQFLRRGFTANTNDDFTTELLAHLSSTDNRVAVAIDHGRLLREDLASEWFELDRWFGPPFRLDRLDEPLHQPELTVHEDPDGVPALLSPYKKTEFNWSSDGQGLKRLEIEELLRPDQEPLSGFMISRYAHSIRDTNTKQFIHLDGAVRLYPTDAYETRFRAKIHQAPKAEKYIKLFRIDGNISGEDWTGIVTSFFRGNHHVIDYLDPNLEERDPHYREYKESMLELSRRGL